MRYFKFNISTLVSLVYLCCFHVSATGQIKDRLWIGDTYFAINELPINELFSYEEIKTKVESYKVVVYTFDRGMESLEK